MTLFKDKFSVDRKDEIIWVLSSDVMLYDAFWKYSENEVSDDMQAEVDLNGFFDFFINFIS